MKNILSLSLFSLSLLVLGCKNDDSYSSLKRNAIPNDESSAIVKFNDGGAIRYVLASKGKGYELVCSNPVKLKKLIAATGFPVELLGDLPAKSVDSQAYIDLNISKQPKIECTVTNKRLFKVDLDETTKYFFSDGPSAARLYMIGCQALVDAMGFDAKRAERLDAALIDDLMVTTVNDEDDINCLDGVSIGAKLVWQQGDNQVVKVNAGKVLELAVYSAKLPTNEAADVSVKSKEGACQWLGIQKIGESLVISGQVPEAFTNQSCQVTLVAAAGTIFEDTKTYTVVSEVKKPVLTSNCAKKTLLLNPYDFKECSVSTDVGTLQSTLPVESGCDGVFTFDAATGKLKILKMPALGEVCTMRVTANFAGISADPVAVTVEKQDGCFSETDGRVVPIDSIRETGTLVYKEATPAGLCSKSAKSQFIVCQKGGTWSAPRNPEGFASSSCQDGCFIAQNDPRFPPPMSLPAPEWYPTGAPQQMVEKTKKSAFVFTPTYTGSSPDIECPMHLNPQYSSMCESQLLKMCTLSNGSRLENLKVNCSSGSGFSCSADCMSDGIQLNVRPVKCTNGVWQ